MSAVRDVALVPSAYAPSLGGVEELTSKLAGELHRRGIRPSVATARWPRSLARTEDVNGTRVWRGVFCTPEPNIRSLAKLVRHAPLELHRFDLELRRSGSQVMHVQCVSGNGLYAAVAARRRGIPLVVSLQGEVSMDADEVYRRSSTLPHVLTYLMKHADFITACSAHTLNEAAAFCAMEMPENARVVYNGVSVQEFQMAAPEVRGGPYILATGRHVPQKGFDVLLRAFAESGAAASHELVLAGDGPCRDELTRLARGLRIDASVHLPGRCDRRRTASLFKGCDFFVLPSRHEPMGIVNLEAMAAGKAVIAAAVGGVPEIVRSGETGILVKGEDASGLASAIRHLTSDRDARERLGRSGQIWADRFDWSRIASEYIDIYEHVTKSRKQAVLCKGS